MENAYSLFPRLKELARQAGGTLSDGDALLLDESSMGIAPNLAEGIFETI